MYDQVDPSHYPFLFNLNNIINFFLYQKEIQIENQNMILEMFCDLCKYFTARLSKSSGLATGIINISGQKSVLPDVPI